MATNDLFVPVLADFLSFHGLKLLFETVQSLEDDLGHVLDHVFIVVNAFNQTFKLAKEAREALQQHYPEFLLPKVVRQCTKFAQASSEGVPVFLADRDCKGAQDIESIIELVLERLAQAQPAPLASASNAG
jgi:chromosome partitioning protein